VILLRQYKAVLIAAGAVGLVTSGWVAQGWRMGKKIEAQRADYAEAKGRRGQAYADTLAQAATLASGRITEAQALLTQARATKARALAEAAQTAPKGPEFACRDIPLPETHLETYRQ
jgi:hypothetical protein